MRGQHGVRARRLRAVCRRPARSPRVLMDHTPGQRQFVSVDKYREYNQGKYGPATPRSRRSSPSAGKTRRRGGGTARHRSPLPEARVAAGQSRRCHPAPRGGAVQAGSSSPEFPPRSARRALAPTGSPWWRGAPNLVLGRSHSGNVSAAELAARTARHPLLRLRAGQCAPPRSSSIGRPAPRGLATVTATPAQRAALTDRVRSPRDETDLVRVRVSGRLPWFGRCGAPVGALGEGWGPRRAPNCWAPGPGRRDLRDPRPPRLTRPAGAAGWGVVAERVARRRHAVVITLKRLRNSGR
jgi:hypothetical protein